MSYMFGIAYDIILKPAYRAYQKYVIDNHVGPYVNSFNQEYESMFSSPNTMGGVMMGF